MAKAPQLRRTILFQWSVYTQTPISLALLFDELLLQMIHLA